MEALNRLVTESLARHGFNRPVDPRRLQWSRWFLCHSPHSLLVVPSKPGIFAVAEEICGGADSSKRMLAVLQFSDDDDMAFTLDRMFTKPNAMRERLASGRCFVRFVVIEEEDQRRSVCAALNQWLISSAEKASGIPAGFSSSLEFASVESVPTAALSISAVTPAVKMNATVQPAYLGSECNENRHCPQPFPSGF